VTYKEDWDKLVKNEITNWRDFHRFWIEQSKSNPVLFFRFEDLTSDPESVLNQVFRFVLDLEPGQLEGTVLESAIKKVGASKKEGQ
jgi:Sulfotransferase domain